MKRYDHNENSGPSRPYFEWWLMQRSYTSWTQGNYDQGKEFGQKVVDRWGAMRRRLLTWAERIEWIYNESTI